MPTTDDTQLLLLGLNAKPRSCRIIPLSDVDNATLLGAFALWNGLRGDGKFPSRNTVSPRVMKPILRYTSLLRVLDGGADYEYRIVGDAYVMAHGHSFQGKRWSELGAVAPGFQNTFKPIYDQVVQSGEPLALRGWLERGGRPGSVIFCEYLLLPLGEADGGVDHILNVAVYGRRDGIEQPPESGSFSA
jgi:hypothetical protein